MATTCQYHVKGAQEHTAPATHLVRGSGTPLRCGSFLALEEEHQVPGFCCWHAGQVMDRRNHQAQRARERQL